MRGPDLLGRKFGRLTVVEFAGSLRHHRLWICACECGGKPVSPVPSYHLLNGRRRSCGCLKRENPPNVSHGQSRGGHLTPEYAAFKSAKARCRCPGATGYKNYGGRGIQFLFESFEGFLKEVGPKPSPDHQIDRIDNNGHYEPGNIRWATRLQQVRNRRRRNSVGEVAL